jgi:hypothetical protein
MILVLSFDHFEQGTDPVIDWLLYYGADFMRLNGDFFHTSSTDWLMDIHQNDLILDNGVSLKKDVNAIFFRRFSKNVHLGKSAALSREKDLEAELSKENRYLINYFLYALKDKYWLPGYEASNFSSNKLIILNEARECGFNVPEAYIIKSKADLRALMKKFDNQIIIKPINYCQYYFKDDGVFTSFTHKPDEDTLKDLPETFFPSLVQRKIQGQYELRIFYLEGKCYTEVSLNQEALATASDIKLIQNLKTTHFVPYNLPKALEEQIDVFMKKIGLNTGSVDIIRDTSGEYHFIEVNPAGQYLAPSQKCNFQLDRMIAEHLIQKDKAL